MVILVFKQERHFELCSPVLTNISLLWAQSALSGILIICTILAYSIVSLTYCRSSLDHDDVKVLGLVMVMVKVWGGYGLF